MTLVDPRDPILAAIRRMAKAGGPRFDPQIAPVVYPVIIVTEPGLEAPSTEAGVTGQTSIPKNVSGPALPVFWIPTGNGTAASLAGGGIRSDRFSVAENSGTEYILEELVVTLQTGTTQASGGAGDVLLFISPYQALAANPTGFNNTYYSHQIRVTVVSDRQAYLFMTKGGELGAAEDYGSTFRWLANDVWSMRTIQIPRMRLFSVPGGSGGEILVQLRNSGGNTQWEGITIRAVLTAVSKGSPE